MILTRFCSKAEYDAYMRGEELVNNTDHYHAGRGGSTSQGFCFTPDTPRRAWRYLKGIVTPEVCMILNIPDSQLKRTFGKYPDYSDNRVLKACLKKEYCCTMYSNKTAELLRMLPVSNIATPEEIKATKLIQHMRRSNKNLSDYERGLYDHYAQEANKDQKYYRNEKD